MLTGPEEAALVFAGAFRDLATGGAGPGRRHRRRLDRAGARRTGAVGVDGHRLGPAPRAAPGDDPPTAEEWGRCVRDIDEHLDGCGLDLAAARAWWARPGTIKTLAAGVLDLPLYDRDPLDGAVLGAARRSAYAVRLIAMTVAERRALPVLCTPVGPT